MLLITISRNYSSSCRLLSLIILSSIFTYEKYYLPEAHFLQFYFRCSALKQQNSLTVCRLNFKRTFRKNKFLLLCFLRSYTTTFNLGSQEVCRTFSRYLLTGTVLSTIFLRTNNGTTLGGN